MKEIHEFRIFKDYYSKLSPNDATFNGINYILKIPKEDSLFEQIGRIDHKLRKLRGEALFGYWEIKRYYTKKELAAAKLFHFNVPTAFEPTGEECGTIYDETVACEICGANRKQIGLLKLKKGSIPKKDISRTIAGEIVVSQRLATACKLREIKGIMLEPILFEKESTKHYQLVVTSPELQLTKQTITGKHPFDLSNDDVASQEFTVSGDYKVQFEKVLLNCPKGHLIGSRLISAPHVFNTPAINHYDSFITTQKLGAKQGLLRPEPLYLCSQAFRKMVEEEKFSGFEFEIANIE